MYRLLWVVCLISVAAAADSRWPWQRKPSEVSAASLSASATVSEIKLLMMNVERKMQRFCRKYTHSPLEENYGPEYYRLQANLTGCQKEAVEVRAGQRLVSVQARDLRCDYIALRLLPIAVDANSAFWRFENGLLKIFFPYEMDHGRCGRVISDAIHTLPEFDTFIGFSNSLD